MLENHDKPYVLCVRGNERLMMGDFRTHKAGKLNVPEVVPGLASLGLLG
jgi:hypothetical protein